ncbi:MAG: NAD(P)/FAD-dependent oxidoreductase [Bacteroidia bacterium]|nr:NAD(P)/FAD-dependent oxidoreductase [Bacteroidia bacterium]
MKSVIIIGGGLAGLISSILLARKGVACTLIERKAYPMHRVCGEYVSNETRPFLEASQLFPMHLNLPAISRFQLSSTSGKSVVLPLDLGGFGVSRYAFDAFLFEQAKAAGVAFQLEQEVESVIFANDRFQIKTRVHNYEADVVVGAHGKRSKLDVAMNRGFMLHRSPYVAVKYHLRTEHPADLIALHNFEGGYCGVSRVENEVVNMCYLTIRDNLRRYGDIAAMEAEVLWRNPLLRSIISNSDRIFDSPLVINEISFATKQPVENHVLMAGDAAGMITPLCGNGMAMAIHSAKVASALITDFASGKTDRETMEHRYRLQWRKLFARRLWAGRQIQKLFGSSAASKLAIALAIHSRPVANAIIRNTHGDVF